MLPPPSTRCALSMPLSSAISSPTIILSRSLSKAASRPALAQVRSLSSPTIILSRSLSNAGYALARVPASLAHASPWPLPHHLPPCGCARPRAGRCPGRRSRGAVCQWPQRFVAGTRVGRQRGVVGGGRREGRRGGGEREGPRARGRLGRRRRVRGECRHGFQVGLGPSPGGAPWAWFPGSPVTPTHLQVRSIGPPGRTSPLTSRHFNPGPAGAPYWPAWKDVSTACVHSHPGTSTPALQVRPLACLEMPSLALQALTSRHVNSPPSRRSAAMAASAGINPQPLRPAARATLQVRLSVLSSVIG